MSGVTVADKEGIGAGTTAKMGNHSQRSATRSRRAITRIDDQRASTGAAQVIGDRSTDNTSANDEDLRPLKSHLPTDNRRQIGDGAGACSPHRISHIAENAADLRF